MDIKNQTRNQGFDESDESCKSVKTERRKGRSFVNTWGRLTVLVRKKLK